MEPQFIIALILVGLAVSYLAVQMFRELRGGKEGCGGGCGCAKAPRKDPSPRITLDISRLPGGANKAD